ncbi:MAG: hypothetical protein U5K43_12115 [Halofilum sp. (in: g-proteobacteria)]|nr:hypothetical protein [Halofilum sp. (in: g-proteobacteria)]
MVWGARAFFVWLSVFNLFVVSVFWSFMADLFDDRAGGAAVRRHRRRRQCRRHRRAGADRPTWRSSLEPSALLPIAAGVLALTLPCMWALNRWSHRRRDGGARADPATSAP